MERLNGVSRRAFCEFIHLHLSIVALLTSSSFAGTGAVSVIIAWFLLPEVARRTPGEIDEM